MKYLVLLGDCKGQFFYNINNSKSIRLYNLYRSLNIILRLLRKIISKTSLPLIFTYGSWKKLNENFDKVIIEDCTVDKKVIMYIRKKFPNAELIYWFRNSLNAVDYRKSKLKHLDHAFKCDRIISFDKVDCQKYGFSYLENCYEKDISLEVKNINYTMIFLGTDKSRYDKLIDVIKYTESLGWDNYIHIYSYTRKENQYISHQFLSYREYLIKVLQSKVILDIVDNSYQHGYTLRVFEALFYKRKLLTNCKEIKNEPFYNKNNIFVFDENDLQTLVGLDEFINLPYVEIDEKIIQKYEFYEWLQKI